MKFKPEDFSALSLGFGTYLPNELDRKKIADMANAKLAEWSGQLQKAYMAKLDDRQEREECADHAQY